VSFNDLCTRIIYLFLQVEYGQEVIALRLAGANMGSDTGWCSVTGSSPLDAFLNNSHVAREGYPLHALTSTNKVLECDLIVCAIGVESSTTVPTDMNLETSVEGWMKVDDHFRTSCRGVYAAGDACLVNQGLDRCSEEDNYTLQSSDATTGLSHWFQMKLWSQARSMGDAAAKSILDDLINLPIITTGETDTLVWRRYKHEPSLLTGIPFQIFTHMTSFFGYKVILLGRFNAQGINNTTAQNMHHFEAEIKNIIVKQGMKLLNITFILPS
jgi:hypothetical protein